MWFGTQDGLNRFDGYKFRIFRNHLNDNGSLSRALVYGLNQDNRGNVWIGTIQGASVYDLTTERFTSVQYRDHSQDSLQVLKDVIRVLGTDSRNNVFLGAENLGLLYCKDESTNAIRIPFSSSDSGKRTSISIQAIKEGPGNKLWVFVQNEGLFLLDYSVMMLKKVNSTVRYIRSLEIDGDKIWIGTPGGVYLYDPLINQYQKLRYNTADAENTDDVMCLSLDSSHNLWIGTNGAGIKIWNPVQKRLEQLTAGDSKYSLSSGVVFDIFFDEQGRNWIGTQKGGIDIVDPKRKRFQNISHDPGITNGLKGNSITSFWESANGNLWIGTDDAGINLWDRKNQQFVNFPIFSNQQKPSISAPITTIHKGEGNDVWIGTWTDGIKRLNAVDHHIKGYKCINPTTNFENPVINFFYEDRKGTLWASALRQGNRYAALYYYNKTSDRFDAFDTNLSDIFILTEDTKGDLWGGNLTQLVQIDRINKQHKYYYLGFTVRVIHEDAKGRLWVGTEGGGLVLFDPKSGKSITRYTTDNGLSNNVVLALLEDKDGNLWMSTLNGLSKFNPETSKFKNYYHSDGLQSNQFNHGAAVQLRTGELAFGGIKGFNIFRPEAITAINEAPPVAMTSIKINNKPIDFSSENVLKGNDEIVKLVVPYNQAVLSFEFAALEYSAPEKISYAYYLEGWDRSWNYTGNLRTANYTHLTEGSYIFRVKSSNAEGEWKGKEVIVNITILPPWFRTWWAFVLYVAIAGSIIYLLWRYRIRQARLKYEVAIAKVNVEKEKIEKEKHQAEYEKEKAVHEADRVINEKEKEINQRRVDFFTNITHEFRTPLTLIINPARDLLRNSNDGAKNTELAIIYRNAKRMLSLVDQLLFFRKADIGIEKVRPVKLNFYTFCQEVYLCFVQQAKSREIRYDFICDNPHLELYVDREKMEIVLYNLLSNAIKYAPNGGTVEFMILEEDEKISITITDNGSGIPTEIGDKLFEKFYKAESHGAQSKPGFGIGLYLVKQFAQAHSGEISYESDFGKGSTFTLTLLKGNKHFDTADLILVDKSEPAFLHEINESDDIITANTAETSVDNRIPPIISSKPIMLVVDDDDDIRQYIAGIFKDQFIVHEANNGIEGFKSVKRFVPDIIISDIKMENGDGIDFCKQVKLDPSYGHIPVILLTGTHSSELKLEGVEGGADDYITKPFEKELLIARVSNLQKNKENLQKFFFNEITLNRNDLKISEEYKEFLERCITIVEAHLEDDEFSIVQLAAEMGRSYSSVYKKIKMISGQSLKGFVRYIRLRKAAELFINSNLNVGEVAFQVGIYDARYFREEFTKLFGLKPSAYIKKYRKSFQSQYNINPDGSQ
jgi:signal transduction histidine kinase/ligand-binding sensor domain-containing protein/DNA-binding response OmpR family regulator